MPVPEHSTFGNRWKNERHPSILQGSLYLLSVPKKRQKEACAVRRGWQADLYICLRSLYRILAADESREIRQEYVGCAVHHGFRGCHRRRREDFNPLVGCQAIEERALRR